jgi:hypothetical protein
MGGIFFIHVSFAFVNLYAHQNKSTNNEWKKSFDSNNASIYKIPTMYVVYPLENVVIIQYLDCSKKLVELDEIILIICCLEVLLRMLVYVNCRTSSFSQNAIGFRPLLRHESFDT